MEAAAVSSQTQLHDASLDTVAGVIRDWATRTPDAVALGAPARVPLTYGQLGQEIARITAMLNANDIQRNDRVALVLPNGPEMAIAFLGVAAGATAAPLNPGY